ncbi:putative hydroxypyruvate isomerase isoform X6 [Stegostoma tigrinum]|uniref:putative hydroxypyruvate isomerase isoform X6 n=1 Tax=Stegostoma tigrinum TaxID=3053191 RepID=UPI00286FC2AE|nr:putative hydroxypyruvate isomerase isoform X6 [Stegostoma tigrinum]
MPVAVPMPYPLRFAANLSWLFLEFESLCQRVEAAAQAGFKAVEVAWPYDTEATQLKEVLKRNGMEIVMINTPPGNKAKGELGLGALPMQHAEFRTGLESAVKYAKAVGCKQIHLMAGRVPVDLDRTSVTKEMETTFIENLKYAADILSKEEMLGLIEPINSRITDPYYFLNTPHQGHVQIAQAPNRNEPDSPGEINYSYIFSLLEKLGYQGYIGCEYSPKGGTVDGLGWLRSYWTNQDARKLPVSAKC